MAIILSTTAASVSSFIIFLSLVSLFISWTIRKSRTKKADGDQWQEAPKAGGAWPVIGHLHLLAAPEPTHRVLGTMADKYGPVFAMKLGVHQALVVSNWEMAKECLTTHDKTFASRPRTMASELLGYNFLSIAISPYNSYWRQSRKIATIELLSNQRLQQLKHVRESEMKASIRRLFEACSSKAAPLEMNHWIENLVLDIILKIIAGVRYTSDDGTDWQQHITDFFAFFGKFVLSDALPFLKCLDIGGNKKPMRKTAQEFDIILQRWLDEHKTKMASGEVKGDEDFMYVMLSLLDDGRNTELLPREHDADTIIKAISQTLFLAAADTTTVTMTWLIALLLNNRNVLKKAQEEIDTHVGTGRQVNDSDMKNLDYLHAIIKEAMRLYPAAPLLIPHLSTADCTVGGYHVPAGTQLFVNTWKIHRDPRVWEEPHEFKPERFLTTNRDIDLKGQNFELLPFGSGRRMCPGVSFALQAMQLLLATLLQGFDFATPSDEPVDMEEEKSLALAKATPLQVVLTPRLSASLYC